MRSVHQQRYDEVRTNGADELSGWILPTTGTGTGTVIANQAGGGGYAPATPVLQQVDALPRRLTREEIAARHPALLDSLRTHPHVGWMLVRSASHGPVVLGARCTCTSRADCTCKRGTCSCPKCGGHGHRASSYAVR